MKQRLCNFGLTCSGSCIYGLQPSGLNHTEAAQKLGVSEAKIIDLEQTTTGRNSNWIPWSSMAGKAGLKIRLTLDKAA
jgi:hypothetical protein